MTAWMLSKYGNNDLKNKYMKSITSMENICSYCLTEPGSGSDAIAMKTKGKPDKDNSSLNINGSKSFISGAGVSDLYFVMMKTETSKIMKHPALLLKKIMMEFLLVKMKKKWDGRTSY